MPADFFVAGLSITEDPFMVNVSLLSVGLFRSQLLVEGLSLLVIEPVNGDPRVGGVVEGYMDALELRLLNLLLGNDFTLDGDRLLFLTTNGNLWFRVFSLDFLEAFIFSHVSCDGAACEEARLVEALLDALVIFSFLAESRSGFVDRSTSSELKDMELLDLKSFN